MVTFTLAVGASLLLFGSGLFSFFTPLPFSFLLFRRGSKAALAAVGLSLGLIYFLYQLPQQFFTYLPGMVFHPYLSVGQVRAFALVGFFYYAWIGVSLSWVGTRPLGWEKGVGQVAGSAILLVGLLLIAVAQGTSFDLMNQSRGAIEFLIRRVVELNPNLPPEERQLLAGSLVSGLWHLFPSLWINMTLLVIVLNSMLLRRWVAKKPFLQWGDFSLWRLRESSIWLPILTGCLYFSNLYFFKKAAVSWACLNLLMVLATLYFFQGWAIFSFMAERRWTLMMRTILFLMFFIFFQPLALLLILVGLFDFWFNFRKLGRGNAVPQ